MINSEYHLCNGVRVVVTPWGGVVFGPTLGRYYKTNPFGTRILIELEHGFSLAALLDAVSNTCTVHPDRVRKDVDTFLHRLVLQGLCRST